MEKENVNVEIENELENQQDNQPQLDIDSLSLEDAKKILNEMISASNSANEKLDNLQEMVNSLDKQSAEYKDKWYRAVAELENYKKRNSETRKNAYFDGRKEVILSILVIGDSIERALQLPMDDKTKEGLNLVHRQFIDTLNSLNVSEIDPLGLPFDPNTCEAIHVVPVADGELANMVKSVFKKGYKLEDKIIRYAQVVVTN